MNTSNTSRKFGESEDLLGDSGENLAQTVERLTVDPLRLMKVESLDDGDLPIMLVPDGFTLHQFIDHQLTPVRTKQIIHVQSMDSFIAYLERFIDKGTTVIFHGYSTAPFVRAVFDYDTKSIPGWGEHAVHFDFRKTPEWDAWAIRDGQFSEQTTFAEFVEDYAQNIVTHGQTDALVMVEAARAFKATKTLEFESEKRDHDGTLHMIYAEKAQASARGGEVTIPEEFAVEVVPYFGGSVVKLLARFRYRVTRDGLSMGFRFVRPELVLEPLIMEMIEGLKQYELPLLHIEKPRNN